jgi:tetratricopeptide (TPR) repeat protein
VQLGRLVVLAMIVALGAAEATPGQDLDNGRNYYKSQDYDSAYKTLNSLLYPNIELARPTEIWEAYVLLGGSAYMRGDRQRAIDEFKKALRIDLDRTITTTTHKPEVVQLFEDIKSRYKAEIEIEAEKERQRLRAKQIQDYLDTIGVYETNSYGVNFVPVAAQYQNKQPRKGQILGGAMALTGGTSVATFIYLGGKYGLSSNRVPLAEGPRVRQLQQLEIGTGVAFLVIYGSGVIDAMINFKSQRRLKGDDKLIPTDLIDPAAPNKKPPPPKKKTSKTSLRDRLLIGPIVTPTGVGVGLGWEND